MAGLLRKIVSALRSESHPVPGVSALLKPLSLVDAHRVWNAGLSGLEEALAAEGSRLRKRDARVPAGGNAAASLHPYSSPRQVPDLPPGIPPTSMTLRTSRLAATVDHDTAAAYLRLIRLYGDRTYPPPVVPPSATPSGGPKAPIALPAGPGLDNRPGGPGPRQDRSRPR